MLIYNVGFIDTDGHEDETQLSVEDHVIVEDNIVELINLIFSLKDEMGIKEITYIEDGYEEDWYEEE
jgi:hypothetical protein